MLSFSFLHLPLISLASLIFCSIWSFLSPLRYILYLLDSCKVLLMLSFLFFSFNTSYPVLTWFKYDDSFQTCILCGVDLDGLELGNYLLKYPYFRHHGDHSLWWRLPGADACSDKDVSSLCLRHASFHPGTYITLNCRRRLVPVSHPAKPWHLPQAADSPSNHWLPYVDHPLFSTDDEQCLAQDVGVYTMKCWWIALHQD